MLVPGALNGKEDEIYVVLEEKGRENVCFVLVFRGFRHLLRVVQRSAG